MGSGSVAESTSLNLEPHSEASSAAVSTHKGPVSPPDSRTEHGSECSRHAR